jgi:hypothetical protein
MMPELVNDIIKLYEKHFGRPVMGMTLQAYQGNAQRSMKEM